MGYDPALDKSEQIINRVLPVNFHGNRDTRLVGLSADHVNSPSYYMILHTTNQAFACSIIWRTFRKEKKTASLFSAAVL